MKETDYIVVGCGLAGIAFCEQLRQHDKSFVVFDNHSQQSSRVAAGLYNPVVLKRFTSVWNAKSQLEFALPKYAQLEALLNVQLNHEIPVCRRFTSVEEQNEWLVASDKPNLNDFLSVAIKKNYNPNINADFGFGEVLHSGRINSTLLTRSYSEFLKRQQKLIPEAFEYDAIDVHEESIHYNSIKSRHIVFAEGFGLHQNPYFNTLPLKGTKGEMLTIKAPDLKMDFILKSSVFIVPLGNDLYWIGATYEWEDKTHKITEEARDELLKKVRSILKCEFEIVDQVAGIRPTTKDRRPLVGQHPTYHNLFLINGLGTRGIMIAPFVAAQLFNYIENDMPLDSEIDIQRFVSNSI